MMSVGLSLSIPGGLEERRLIFSEINRNADSGQGVIITMPDGFSFDAVIDEVSS
jgi:hypothetical protein